MKKIKYELDDFQVGDLVCSKDRQGIYEAGLIIKKTDKRLTIRWLNIVNGDFSNQDYVTENDWFTKWINAFYFLKKVV